MFDDRIDAAHQLADALKKQEFTDPIVVALPRGGVPMGDIVAKALNVPLEIVVPRKIGHPTNEEYAIGALAEEGDVIWNEKERAAVQDEWAEKAVSDEREEARRRREVYGLGKPRKSFSGKDVILVDDGIATGLTMKAAISTIKKDNAKSVTVAIPVAPPGAVKDIKKLANEVICLEKPRLFMAVGNHYRDFPQTSDDEVLEIMKKHI